MLSTRLFIALAVALACLVLQHVKPSDWKVFATAGWQPAATGNRTDETLTASIGRQFSYCSVMPRRDCVVDGDTFYFGREKVRIADIDTPEVFSPHCAREKRLGDRASARLRALLNAGPIELKQVDRNRDSYGRLLRIVYLDNRSIGTILVDEGLAHRWTGRRLPWCSRSRS